MEKERILSYALLGTGVVFFLMGLVKVVRGEEDGEDEATALRRTRLLIVISLLLILASAITMMIYKKGDMTKKDIFNAATVFLAAALTLILAIKNPSLLTLGLGTVITAVSSAQLILE